MLPSFSPSHSFYSTLSSIMSCATLPPSGPASSSCSESLSCFAPEMSRVCTLRKRIEVGGWHFRFRFVRSARPCRHCSLLTAWKRWKRGGVGPTDVASGAGDGTFWIASGIAGGLPPRQAPGFEPTKRRLSSQATEPPSAPRPIRQLTPSLLLGIGVTTSPLGLCLL